MKSFRTVLTLLVICVFSFSGNVYPEGEEPIYLGILPLRRPTEMLKRFENLEKYLRKETGLNIRLRFYPTTGVTGGFAAIVSDIAEGNIDFAWLNSVTCVQAHGVGPVVPFATAQRKGRPYYVGYLAVRADSPYTSHRELRNKRVAGTSASSVSGNLMPSAWLLNEGYDKFTYYSFYYLGRQDNAAQAVIVGEFDGCFINESTFDSFNEGEIRLKKLWEHPPVPEHPFCVNTERVSSEVLSKVKTALFEMDKKDLAGIKAVDEEYEEWKEFDDDFGSYKWFK